jgi:hypothetical protein
VRKLSAASIEEIAAVPGIGTRLAATISGVLARGGDPPEPPAPGGKPFPPDPLGPPSGGTS